MCNNQQTYLVRYMSHESLALCSESLGSDTGRCTRGDFLDQATVMACLYQTTDDDSTAALADSFLPPPPALQEEQDETEAGELTAVRYHRARPLRAFPPPLPSMSRRRDDDGPCLRMRPHRRDGRLVVEAVAVKAQGYLHARRQDGRLRLCFVDCASSASSVLDQKQSMVQPRQEELVRGEEEEEDDVVEEEEEEEDDEVEVVDRGTVVEVVAASGKAQRCSRIVINKFVGRAPVTDDVSPSRCSRAVPAAEDDAAPPAPGLRRLLSSTTTLAAAVAAASTGMEADDEEEEEEADNRGHGEEKQSASTMLLFTSRVGDREELVKSVRRCRQLRQRPLFIVEPYPVIAT